MSLRAAFAALAFPLLASAQTYQGRELVEPRLVADTSAIVPGKPFRVGVVLKMAQDWHTYWQYGGDAGAPTQIKWQLPAGFGAGPIEWPLPESILEPGDILVYAYGGEIMLTQTIQPPADLKSASVELKANVSWLVCAEICVPGKASLSLTLPVAASARPANQEAFAEAASKVPSMEAPPFSVRRAPLAAAPKEGAPPPSPATGATDAEFFPAPSAEQEVGHPVVTGNAQEGFDVSVEAKGGLRGVLAVKDASGALRGWWVTLPPPPMAAPAAAGGWAGLLAALGGGLLGGLILNLMPCVLPVISLKIFGFVQQAGQSRRRIALHGLSFSAGVFTFFLALGALVCALRAGGSSVTWGFQFQSPLFVLSLAAIVFAFALNLFGVFELTLPGRASTALNEAGTADGYGGSFFQGAFATLLATPCTAPFLGYSLGLAFGQSAVVIMLMFASVATGMSLPYLALSLQPGWVRYLPKPGAWMERLKQFMGFPLLATLVWLFSVFGAQRGLPALIGAAAFLVALGLALWLYGLASSPTMKTRSRAILQILAAALALGGGWTFLIEHGEKIAWVPYSKSEVERLIAEEKPVFVDFTAEWCLSCKVNERTAIDVAAVRAKIKELGIVPVKADWTNANPEITAALQRFGRVGVPFYVLYPAGKSAEPITLPEFLTESLVLDALSKAR